MGGELLIAWVIWYGLDKAADRIVAAIEGVGEDEEE